jgi:septal ring factor EnvC (AmiA/AmiB activator)
MRTVARARSRPLAVLAGFAISAAVLIGPWARGQDERNTEAALASVRKEIKEVEARVAREQASRDAGAKALRGAEVNVATAARKLAKVRADLREQQNDLRSLGQDTSRAQARLADERDALAGQVRLHYMTGREELFKLLLSQETPATLGRMLVYFDYYNRARAARIAVVASDLAKLAELENATSLVQAGLTELEASQATEVAALERARDERRATLAKLDADLRDDTAAATKLKDEERRLTEVVKRLAELAAGFPVDTEEPFARVKGKLAWPVEGRLAGDFGQPRGAGPVKWTGVLLEATAGTPVRAVYHGRVAFADWLQGLGLLVIVDHGGGYMSLYGHNEALLKESGDWVEPGETIAQVGDSGGQTRPGLYFEIRYNGEPVNPHSWISRDRGAAR